MTQPAEYRSVVTWQGSGEPIMLAVYDPDGAVVSVPLSPKRALELAKDLMERAVMAIKTGQWGSEWPATHVVILVEMVHDARVIRMDAEHDPAGHTKWLGDAIGWWENDTLVVDTTNFRDTTGLYGGDENLHLVERFTKQRI